MHNQSRRNLDGHTGGRRRTGLHPLLLRSLRALRLVPVLTDRARDEAASLKIARCSVELRNLPKTFDGMTIAFLSDFHCGDLTPPAFLEKAVSVTNQLKPDLILLGGDYISHHTTFIRAIGRILGRLTCRFGVYAVLGNHDYWVDEKAIRSMLRDSRAMDLTNDGVWLTIGMSRIRIAGVGDLWEDKQDLAAALADAGESDVAILLSHNPDYAPQISDKRVKLVLSGHTHGGQICLPGLGPLITNSKYGNRLASGLIPFGSFQLYVSRGLGTVVVPLRYNCPPEITLLTLKSTETSGPDHPLTQELVAGS